MLYGGLYLVALGVSGIKGSLPPNGAEQFDESTPEGRKHQLTFFNYFVFSLLCGALMAVTFVVWIEDNIGWQWGFGVSTATILISNPIFLLGPSTYRIKVPAVSPITTMVKAMNIYLHPCLICIFAPSPSQLKLPGKSTIFNKGSEDRTWFLSLLHPCFYLSSVHVVVLICSA